MNRFKIIAITHKYFDIAGIGKFHIAEEEIHKQLSAVKETMGIDELMFLSTCNRVEFLLSSTKVFDINFVREFILSVYPEMKNGNVEKTISSALFFEGKEAIKHIFSVVSSIDSLVVGEREIITQVRSGYQLCNKLNLTGDLLRLVIQKAIECGKNVYTHTNISRNPVSVVSLAYRKLRNLNVKLDGKFLIVGAGITNTSMSKYLRKHGFCNFVVFNRTLANGEKLASVLSGKSFHISELSHYKDGFDVIITCVSSSEKIITKEIYKSLVGKDTDRKIVIDLAVPNNLDEEILKSYDVNLIAVSNLQEIAKKNLLQRKKELNSCEKIIEQHIEEFHNECRERKVELAMGAIPKKVKEIRKIAINQVFAKEIEQLDGNSKRVLDKVVDYLEKKYISVPMKMAKEILIEKGNL